MPHHVYWTCGKDCDAEYLKTNCYGGGKYCAMEPSNTAIQGREIIQEDLRQKCLWLKQTLAGNQTQWFQYIQRIHETCYSVINEDCSRRAHQHLNLDFLVTDDCVQESFSCSKSSWDKSTCRNSIIDAEI